LWLPIFGDEVGQGKANFIVHRVVMQAMCIVQAPNADAAKEDEQSKDRKPLLTKSAVLRLLAELSRSYAGCAVDQVSSAASAGGTVEVVRRLCSSDLSTLVPCRTVGTHY